MPRNRNPVKQWFFTFPQSGAVTKDEFFSVLSSISNVQKHAVCSETHEDGSPHLHALMCYDPPVTFTEIQMAMNKAYPDASKRLDYKPVRSWKNALKYVHKEDPNPLTDQEVQLPIHQVMSTSCKTIKELSDLQEHGIQPPLLTREVEILKKYFPKTFENF